MTGTTWPGRAATPPHHQDEDDLDRRRRWSPVAGIVVVLGLVGAGGYLLAGIDGDDAKDTQPSGVTTEATAGPGATTTTERGDTNSSDTLGSSTTATTTAPEPTSRPSTVPDTTPPTTEAGEDDSAVDDDEVRAAVLRGGVLYLGGAVPNRDVADQIIERAAAVIGEENIVDQYVIDPTAPVDPDAPLYVEDVVLFAYGSPTFDPQFTPLLDLGLLLLSQNPSVTLTVITHTDSSGSASFNQQLSVRRGQSVAQYWIDRGISPDQIVIDARGEREPVADNCDPAGARLNRRAEFYVEGILG